jgi:hypothetical protein
MTDINKQPEVDILADAEAQTTSAPDLRQIGIYAQEMRDIEAALYELKCKTKDFELRYAQIELELLPNLMMAVGVKKFTLSSGAVAEVKDFIRGTIPTTKQIEDAEDMDKPVLQARREECLTWLRSINAESIIKNQVITEFGRGEMETAKKVFATLQAQGFHVKRQEEVNFMTLNSFLKGEVENGRNIPVDAFGLFVGKKASIKEPKK